MTFTGTGPVCIDSNAMTYLVEAMTNGGCPTGGVAAEKIALLRLYLYRDDVLYLPPAVKLEYQKIRDGRRNSFHKQVADVLLGEISLEDSNEIKVRKTIYLALHGKEMDCRILSECELGGGSILLTYDHDLLKRLQGKTQKIELSAPSEFWARLEIPKGTRPAKIPHASNPLSKEDWWVW